MEPKGVSSTEILSTAQKRNGFHGKYLAVCKSKLLMPLPEVKSKQNFQAVDFHADRVKVYDWIAICTSLCTDKTLKFLAIRLRKNTGFVLEEVDTLKKAKTIASTHPVIYSKFLFTELVSTLQNFVTNSSALDTLVLEGLPLSGRFMTNFAIGLTHNRSIKTLSFARCNIGNEACDELCTTLKHLMGVETLNLSGCNLGVKGAEAVANLIKFHKIQRFSEAWIQSLRYRNIDAESIPGLRKVLISNNPEIGDDGLKLLTEVLCEDVWLKEIEMQNCGLSDVGAHEIIKCLNINKTILNFNIAGNHEVPDHLHRHIIMNLGSSEPETSDSSDSKSSPGKLNKMQLLEKSKFLEEKLEMEIFRRKQMEKLHEQLNNQLMEYQKQLNVQGAFQIPDGFMLVPNSTMEELLTEKNEMIVRTAKRRRKRGALIPKKAASCVIARPSTARHDVSKSEMDVTTNGEKNKIFVERNIGDGIEAHREPTAVVANKPMTGSELLQMFKKTKNEGQQPDPLKLPKNFDPRSLFTKSAKRVPENSDAGSDN